MLEWGDMKNHMTTYFSVVAILQLSGAWANPLDRHQIRRDKVSGILNSIWLNHSLAKILLDDQGINFLVAVIYHL